MRKIARLVLAAGIVACWAISALADDIRHRPPRGYWIPGVMVGDYAGESDIASLPDVIIATLESLFQTRAIENLTPIRTLEKL